MAFPNRPDDRAGAAACLSRARGASAFEDSAATLPIREKYLSDIRIFLLRRNSYLFLDQITILFTHPNSTRAAQPGPLSAAFRLHEGIPWLRPTLLT